MVENPAGYSFISGDLSDSELETAIFALKDDKISDLIETSTGFHVVQKFAVPQEYITANHDKMADALSSDDFYVKLDSDISQMKVDYFDEYNNISIDNLNLYLS